MKQVLFNKNGSVFVEDVPIPTTDENSVLVNNVYSVISSGTEKSMIELMKKPLAKMAIERMDLTKQVIDYAKNAGIKKTLELVKSRLDTWHLLGYSSAGYVIKAGKYAVNIGKYDRVACVGSGFANHAEFVNVPHTFVERIPNNVSFKDASFTGVGAIALQSVRQLNPQLGQTIVVVGLGLMGGIVAQILKANGCKVIGIDVDKKKVEKDYIDFGFVSGTANDVMKVTNNIGADGVIIVASSKMNLVDSAFDMCKKKRNSNSPWCLWIKYRQRENVCKRA